MTPSDTDNLPNTIRFLHFGISIPYNVRKLTSYSKSRGKQILEEHYTEIWNVIYVNARVAGHTKLFIPSIFHKKSISIKPNFILTQFLTSLGNFRSYLYKINKAPSPFCNCANYVLQTAQHLIKEFTIF